MKQSCQTTHHNKNVIHTSQIPGPSWLNVPFVPTNNILEKDHIIVNQNEEIEYSQVHRQEEDYTDQIEEENFDEDLPLTENDGSGNVDHNQEIQTTSPAISHDDDNEQRITYTTYIQHAAAHLEFSKIFINNPFGYSCVVCDRLWFKKDLKLSSAEHTNILKDILPV